MVCNFFFANRFNLHIKLKPGYLITSCLGERVLSADNNLLGTFTLRNIPPAPARKESVIVKFDIDANGMLTVNAEHKKTKNSKSIKIDKKVGGELTGREILMLLARAEIMEVEDKIEEERIQSRENFRQFCLEMQLSQSANDPNDLASINEQISWINHHKDSIILKFQKLKEGISTFPVQV